MNEKKTPLLSIGIIFRNDIRCLERCLQALEPLRRAIPCELVMADTGSDDGSREIAARYADILFDFPWVNDFSAARNAVMDRCGGAWFLTVDTDEYLDPEISELVEFLTGPQDKDEIFASVIQRNYRTRAMEPGDCTDFLAQRMVRLSTGLRYQGTVHESFPMPKGNVTLRVLNHTILHHDGYAIDSPEEHQKKLDRDLALLRPELEKDPDNLRRLLQCVEACAYHKEERNFYLNRAMELIRNGSESNPQYQAFAPHLYRHSVRAALQEKLPQAEELLAWGEAHMAGHLSFRIDVASDAALYYSDREDYASALAWAERYEAGCADYDAGRYDPQELMYSPLSSILQITRSLIRLVRCDSLIRLGRQREGGRLLEELDVSRLYREGDVPQRFLWVLTRLTEEPELAETLCGRMLAPLWEAADRKTDGSDSEAEKADEIRRTMVAQADCIFRQVETGPQLFRQAPGDLGRAARSMDLQDPERLTDALAEVVRWEDVPAQAVAHAVKQCAPLPASFYRQSEQALRELAADLGTDAELQARLPLWAVCDDFNASLPRCQFLFQLTAAAVMSVDWTADSESHGELLDLFGQLSAQYLPALYNPALLGDQEAWSAFPALHRAALYFLQAMDARKSGDALGFVRALRVVLQAAPGMKSAVEYLLESRPKSAAETQLEQLAEQVRAVLAQYPPDDPAVIALKQSDAYRKVAHLLE